MKLENKEKLIREKIKEKKIRDIDILLATILSALKALMETLLSSVVYLQKNFYLSFLTVDLATKFFTFNSLKHVVK